MPNGGSDTGKRFARAACEQSGRSRVPTIVAPLTLPDYLTQDAAADCRIALLPGYQQSLDDLPAAAGTVEMLVGPEGGFSDDEVANAIASGFVGVSLGPRILRSETAALVAIALAQAKWGDLRGV